MKIQTQDSITKNKWQQHAKREEKITSEELDRKHKT